MYFHTSFLSVAYPSLQTSTPLSILFKYKETKVIRKSWGSVVEGEKWEMEQKCDLFLNGMKSSDI